MRPMHKFFAELRQRDIRLWLDDKDGGLCYSAPPGALAGALLDELKSRKGEVIAFLQAAVATPPNGLAGGLRRTIPAGVEAPPLSYAQERLWFLNRLEPDNPFYNVAIALRLDGKLDSDALQKSLGVIVARHNLLRTIFPAVDGQAIVRVGDDHCLLLEKVDLTFMEAAAEEEQLIEVERLARGESKRPFDLSQGPLVRVKLIQLHATAHVLLLTMHHIVSDGWSLGVLVDELGGLYTAAVDDPNCDLLDHLPPLPIQYGDFAAWQRKYLQGELLTQQMGYWRKQLAEPPLGLYLPTDRPRPPVQSFKGSSIYFAFDRRVVVGLNRLSQTAKCTLFMTLSAVLSILLNRYSDQDDILIGTPIANRTRPELEKLIGFFVNTLVLRVDLSTDLSFQELLSQVRQTALEAFAHQDLPFEMLVDELQIERDLSRNPLFQVMFALQNAPVDDLSLPGLQVSILEMERQSALFDIVLDMWESKGDSLVGVLEYNTDLFERATMERLIQHFQSLAAAVVVDPTQPVAEIKFLPVAEQVQLAAFNGPMRDYPLDQTIYGLFEAQVAKTPNRVAVSHHGSTLTYAELDQRAHNVACRLQKLGVRTNDFVAIFAERGIDFLASILGVHKAGGAYIPVDPSYPVERVQYMLTNSQTKWVISRLALIESVHLTETAVEHVIDLESIEWPGVFEDEFVAPNYAGDHRAYMLYTSGSTGLPKGAIIRHAGAINHIYGELELLNVADDLIFLQSAPSSSDISVWQFLGPVLCGGRCVIADMPTVADSAKLFALIEREQISLIELVPVVLKGLLDFVAERRKTLGDSAPCTLPHLKWVMVTGEAVQAALINQWLATFPNIPIVNAYGPTEAADDVTQHVMRQALPLDGRPVPIGKPLPNLQIYVVDKRLNLVPIGVPGEICVGGVGVGEGYWRNDEQTTKCFIKWRSPVDPSAPVVVYRTGDWGRWLADGTLEYIERMDQQVKVRGFRIELGEIEGVLDQHEAVDKCALAIRPDVFGEKQLVGYVVAGMAEKELAALQAEQVELWQALHEKSYSDTLLLDGDPLLNVIGWDSNYDNSPLPAAQMREYIDGTVARAQMLQPTKVLEIGCGTGMIAFQLAQKPEIRSYWGTDISEVAISGVRQIQATETANGRLTGSAAEALFEVRAADDFSGWTAGQFDLALLPSVVQYFPSVHYLRKVLMGLAKILAPGGAIYLGDVRSLGLLEAFHASVQWVRADNSVTAAHLKQRVSQQLEQEQEMAVDPAFFIALAEAVPEIMQVEILPKLGELKNEMTAFRYDVILHITPERLSVSQAPSLSDVAIFDGGQLREAELQKMVAQDHRQSFAITGLPNGRLSQERSLLAWLAVGATHETVEMFNQQLSHQGAVGIAPFDLVQLGARAGYQVDLRHTPGRDDGALDALFVARNEIRDVNWHTFDPLGCGTEGVTKIWEQYANNPLREKLSRTLIPQWREFLKARLPNHMVPNRFMLLDRLPLTPMGKVDRSRLPTPDPDRHISSSGYVAPRNKTEERLCAIWQEVLALNQVGIEDNFFDLGGHSLKATQVVSRIQQAFGIDFPLRELFNWPTVAELGAKLLAVDDDVDHHEGQSSKNRLPVAQMMRQPDRPSYPLSHAQHRLWVLAQMGEAGAAYNMPAALLWEGFLDRQALQTAFAQLVGRHESLRTTFVQVDGEPRQVVHADWSVEVSFVDLRDEPHPRSVAQKLAQSDALTPFDLAQGPLMRVGVLQLATDRQVVLVNLHHIVSDGWSEGVLLREFSQLYRACRDGVSANLRPLPIQYRDYAVWERAYLAGEAGRQSGEFWRASLAGELPVLDLPADLKRPRVKTYSGRSHTVLLDEALSSGLRRLAGEQNVTVFMLLTSLVNVLLYRLTGQTEILLGTPVHGRFYPDLEAQVGFYVNTVVLRNTIQGKDPFSIFLGQVKQRMVEAFEHQEYPFDRLVQELSLDRDVSRNPVFDVAIVYQSLPVILNDVWGLAETEISPFVNQYEGSKFDLSFTFEPAVELENQLRLHIVYNTDLFLAERIGRIAAYFMTLAKDVLFDEKQPVDALQILPSSERRLIERFSHGGQVSAADRVRINEKRMTPVHLPLANHLSLVDWFEAQVDCAPDRVALCYGDKRLSYRELNAKANQLGHELLERGVQPGDLIALYVERSIEMVCAILGVLKAGGVYLPCDPMVPAERLAFMLEDAAVKIVVTQAALVSQLPSAHIIEPPILLDNDVSLACRPTANPNVSIKPEDLAYVIYTSGSTGRPKGVMVTHGNVIRLFQATDSCFGFDQNDVWTLFHSYAFDFSVWEIWGALLFGGRLVVVPYQVSRTPDAFYALLVDERVTVLNQTPSAFRQLIQVDGAKQLDLGLRTVIFGGEALDVSGLRPWFERHGDKYPQLVNMYGITETTVHVTYRPLSVADLDNQASLIGRPISDLTVQILDQFNQPVPLGVAGEIVVGGAGVTNGYLNRPELTAERFITLDSLASHAGLETVYRSGDLGRWLPNGDIEYVGRIDSQVKIRGFRIELGEIKAVLAAQEEVAEAIVLTDRDAYGDRLVGFVVAHLDKDVDAGRLRTSLRQKLPGYMVPARIVCVKSWPLTANGKLDQRALMALVDSTPLVVPASAEALPTTDLQKRLSHIWSSVLGTTSVMVDQNFFDLGGDSLRIIQVHAQLVKQTGLSVDVVDLFQYPTIAALAEFLETLTLTEDEPEEMTAAESRAAQQRAARRGRRKGRR